MKVLVMSSSPTLTLLLPFIGPAGVPGLEARIPAQSAGQARRPSESFPPRRTRSSTRLLTASPGFDPIVPRIQRWMVSLHQHQRVGTMYGWVPGNY